MITWLASYPKSGNTWVRAFLSAYEMGPAFSINTMRPTRMTAERKMLSRVLKIDTATLTDPEVQELRPHAYRVMAWRAAEQGRELLFKVHDAWNISPAGEPIFPPDVTRSTVYIVRDPRDVAVSLAHHMGTPFERAVDNLAFNQFSLAITGRGDKDQVRQTLRSWSENVESWIDQFPGIPLVLKYESMVADPVSNFRELLHYLGTPVDELRLKAAVAACNIEALRSQEKSGGFKEASWKAAVPFFRRGQPGGYKEDLAPALIAKVELTQGRVMRRFGYL